MRLSDITVVINITIDMIAVMIEAVRKLPTKKLILSATNNIYENNLSINWLISSQACTDIPPSKIEWPPHLYLIILFWPFIFE